jgi:hypothetical protein
MTGSKSCRRVSETPEIIDGRGVRVYDGKGGSSEASVALENILIANTKRAAANKREESREVAWR